MFTDLFFNSIYENQPLVLNGFLKSIKVKVSLNTIDQTLNEHPDYPSFLSITDSLKKWNVDCLALQANANNLLSIPTPFITILKDRQFIVVREILDDEIKIINQYGKKELVGMSQFIEKWSETIIIAESNELSGEIDYIKKQRAAILNQFIIALIPIGILVSVLVPFINGSVGLVPSLFVVTTLIGLTASVLLLWYDIDKGNPLLKQICSGIQKSSCSAVLNTKAASIGGMVTWSEVGFFYFSSSLLFAAFVGINTVVPVLNVFSLLALPYVIFSIYYQWRVAKQWCVLCLWVQAVLLIEGILTIINNLVSYAAIEHVIITNWTMVLIVFIIPIISWYLLKPLLKRNQAAKYDKRRYLQMKYNDVVFWTLLQKQLSIDDYSTDALGITLGNPNAKNTIIKVCDPYCPPCAKAHPVLDQIIVQNPDIKMQIIFKATNDENDERVQPVKHLLAVAEKGDQYMTHKALDDWYLVTPKNYDVFAAKYPLTEELEMQSDKIINMNKWCENLKINSTPTIFINGRKLPNTYLISEISYFLV